MLSLILLTALAQAEPTTQTEQLYRLALGYLAQGHAAKAIKPLESLLTQEPDSLDGRLLLARAYQGVNEPERAKKLLDDGLAAHPDEVSLLAARGALARSQDDFSAAVTLYLKAVEISPKDASLRFNLGEALHRGGRRLDAAIAAYRQALELEPGHVNASINLGKALAEKGLYGEAKELLQAVNREKLVDGEACYNLGVIALREGNLTAAAAEFERTLKAQPKHPQALNNLGVVYDSKGDGKRALEAFRKATLADPTYAEAFFNLGMGLMRAGRTNEATKAFEQALKLEPASSSPYVKLGSLYLQQGKKDRAVEAFKRALAAQEEEEKKASGFKMLSKRAAAERTSDAYRGLAMAYLAQGLVADAVETLKKAVEKLPNDASARLALGEALLAQGDADGAIEQLKRRLGLEPTTEARLDLARAYTKKRAGAQAESLLKDVLKLELGNREARLGLIDLYTSMGRLGEAESLLKVALEEDANDAQALARFGIMKSRLGRPNEALEPLQKAVELNPALSDARAELAFLLVRGDPANAGRCAAITSDILVNEPRNTLALTYLGFCRFTLGDKHKAEEAFKAALAIDPGESAAHYFLGQLYDDAGKKTEAIQAYQAAADFGDAKEQLKRLQK